MKSLSIIITTNNSQEVLENCIDSILSQSFTDFEIICVDNNSSDKSLELLKSYKSKDDRIRIFSTDKSMSLAKCLNFGLGKASNKYVTFINPEDYLIDNKSFKILIGELEKTNADMVSANVEFVSNKVYKGNTLFPEITERMIEKPENYGIPWYFTKNIFNKSFLDKYDIRFPDLELGEDTVFLMKVLNNLEYYVHIPIWYYSYKSSMDRLNNSNRYVDYIKSFKEIFKLIVNEPKFKSILSSYIKVFKQLEFRQPPNFDDLSLSLLKVELYDILLLFKDNTNIFNELKVTVNKIIDKIQWQINGNKTLISVIIPVYNVEKYLETCLNSVVMQTLKDIEIICVNDASTDSSLEILEDFANRYNNVSIISNENNMGLGASRNIGLIHAKGKYVYFLDSDDWLDFKTLEESFKVSEENNLDMLMFKAINYNPENNEFYKSEYYDMNSLNSYVGKVFNYKTLDDKLLFDLTVSACLKLYNREFIEKHTLRFPENIIHEDNPFFYESFFKAERILILDKRYYTRLRRNNSITSMNNSFLMGSIEIVNMILDIFIEYKVYEQYKEDLLNFCINFVKIKYEKIDLEYIDEYHVSVKKFFNKLIKVYDIKEDLMTYLSDENKIFFNNVLTPFDYTKIKEKYALSVIIPTYNSKRKYLSRALNSLIKQTLDFDKIEIIIVDDASTLDETLDVINQYSTKYENIKVIHLNENKGQGNARNMGINSSSSDYIMFLDHDDYYIKTACATLLNNILNNNLDIVSGNYINLSRDGSVKVYWRDKGLKEYNNKVISVLDNPNLFKVDPSIWAKIYRKDFLIKNNISFKDYRCGQDLLFNQETLFKAEGINFINETIVIYKLLESEENGSISLNNSKETLLTLLDVYKDSYNLFIECDGDNVNLSLNNLNYWIMKRLKLSNLTFDDFVEVVSSANVLFSKFIKNNNVIKYDELEDIYALFISKNYEESYEKYLNYIKE